MKTPDVHAQRELIATSHTRYKVGGTGNFSYNEALRVAGEIFKRKGVVASIEEIKGQKFRTVRNSAPQRGNAGESMSPPRIEVRGARSGRLYLTVDPSIGTMRELRATAQRIADKHREPVTVKRITKMRSNPVTDTLEKAMELTRTHTVYVAYDGNGNFVGYGFDRRYAKKLQPSGGYVQLLPRSSWKRLRKNPAPRETARGAEVSQAAKLYQDFTGHKATTARRVAVPHPTTGLAIGPLLAVAYETTRDGKRERYLHEFRRGARPLLAASHDGRSLQLLGGAYRFTERGIVDGK